MEEDLDLHELEIAKKLRNSCSSDGRELNLSKSAEFLHQLGLIYKARTPDKLSLLQACGLFNAAIVRKPSNHEKIQKDLSDLCKHVLVLSKARNTSADLLQISEEIHKMVKVLRRNVFTKLQMINTEPHGLNREDGSYDSYKIGLIRELQLEITRDFITIVKSISDKTISILGEPPCAYSHVGLGSLARKEVTPFSDFESIVLLEENALQSSLYPNILEYFRWYTVIFQIILLNLGETIVPSLAISSLNDDYNKEANWFFDAYTPRGLCSDGLMDHASKNPLGRQKLTTQKKHKTELIKPLSEMIKYLSTEQDLKNGYHLADMLTTTCYVSGDKSLCNAFQQKVVEYERSDQDSEVSKRLFNQLKDDLNSYAILSSLENAHKTKKFRTKQMVYRSSTLFILYLGKVHHCKSNFSFEILDELSQRGVLTSQAAGNLMHAVGIAYYTRLKTYMSTNKQAEVIPLSKSQPNAELEEMEKIVKIKDLKNYFKIISCLQETIKRGPQEKYEENMDTVSSEVEAGILFYLLQYDDALKYVRAFREKSLLKKNYEKYGACSEFIAVCLFRVGRYDEALEEARNALIQNLRQTPLEQVRLAQCGLSVAKCLLKIGRYVESAYEYEKVLEISDSLDERNHEEKLDYLRSISFAYFKSQNYNAALLWLNREKVVYERIEILDKNLMNKQAICYANIAGCNFKTKKFEEALLNYQAAKNLYTKISRNALKDIEIADCWKNMGHCYFYSKMYTDALQSYQDELAILVRGSVTPEKNANIADCNINISTCSNLLESHQNVTFHQSH